MKASTKKLIRKISLGVLFIFLGIIILSFSFLAFVYYGGFGKLPGDEQLNSIKNPQASEVYSADSVLMGRYYLQNRLDLNEDELTPMIKNALLATEDIRFYEHKGIDFRSLLRVFFKTILLDKTSSGGGSTITQQLAKNLFPRENHRVLSLPVNKLKEMMIAARIEKLYTKDEILNLYLNTVQFGEDTYGLKTASVLFFKKNPASLNIEEAALLVGMLKATSHYNPRKYPERALARRNVVINQLQQYEFLDEEVADSLRSLPLTLNYSSLPFYAGIAPYFREYLRQELDEWCRKNEKENGENYNLYTDGLRVYTSIHSRMQLYAEQSVREHMNSLQKLFDEEWKNRDIWKELKQAEYNYLVARPGNDNDTAGREMTVFSYEGEEERQMNLIDSIKYFMNFLQAGFLAMDVETAEIKAWVGGIDFKFFKYDHVLSERQAGSVFKHILYLAALEEGISPCDFYPNDSIVYEEYENWSPRNADRKYGGSYSMKGALTHSVNTVSAALIMETGIEKVVDMAHLAGIKSDIPDVPSISLGTASVSLFEMLKFYHILASKGMKKETVYLKKITDRQGRLLFNSDIKDSTMVFSATDVEILTAMLQNVVNNGTAASLRYKYGLTGDMAGKTGTTQNHSDGWFIGYTPNIAAGVWVGGELPGIRFRSARQGQGAYSAMPVFALFMQKLYADPEFAYLKSKTFNISDDVKEMLECEDFREQEPFREIIKNRLKRFWFFRKRDN